MKQKTPFGRKAYGAYAELSYFCRYVPERGGFEPPKSCPLLDFESSAFDLSAIFPYRDML